MANLESTYMGLSLRNPFVVGACSMTAHMDALKKMQDAGAGAVVIQSLFEEQILLEKYKMEEDIEMYDDWHAEMTNIFPDMEHDEPYMAHVPPGETAEIVWTFNRAGEFAFACLLPGHYQAGMVAEVTVERASRQAGLVLNDASARRD